LIRIPPGCAFHPRCPVASDFDGVCFRVEPELIAADEAHVSRCHFATTLDDRFAELAKQEQAS
jgi:ABC-type dipeptide/oligopeptide/nickel transport system ATPase component